MGCPPALHEEHMCSSLLSLRSEAGLPSKPSGITANIAEKVYAASGEPAPVLHTKAFLQVFQAELMQSLDREEPNPDNIKDLCAAPDFAPAVLSTSLSIVYLGVC